MQDIVITMVEAARHMLKESGYFVENLWHVDDVHFLCEQRNWPDLSHEEAKSVFAVFNELFNDEPGMNWQKLEQATQVYLAQQGRISGMGHVNNKEKTTTVGVSDTVISWYDESQQIL